MNTKKWAILIGILVVAILGVLFWIKSCNKGKPDIIAIKDSSQYWKNKYGEENISKKQREQDFNTTTAGYLDSIAKLHNTKERLINEVAVLKQKGTVRIITPGAPEIVYKDTGSTKFVELSGVTNVRQHFENPWYRADVDISVAGDSSSIALETFDTLRYVAKTVKEGSIFNRRTYLQVDAVNTNPFNKISGLEVYRKPLPKPKKIGIGVQVGYGFSNSLKPSPYIGAGIQYSIIRL